MAKMIIPPKRESLVDVVHNRILEIIIQEDVTEESVFTESGLVEEFKVSKATVREALVRLCNEHILKSMPRYGYVIQHAEERTAQDICRFRELIEEASLREAFDTLTEEDLQRLRDLLELHRSEQVDKVWDVWKRNIEFHCLLVSFSGNQIYLEHLERIMQRQAIIFAQGRWRARQSFDDCLATAPHDEILQALADRDLDRALRCIHDDIVVSGWH